MMREFAVKCNDYSQYQNEATDGKTLIIIIYFILIE